MKSTFLLTCVLLSLGLRADVQFSVYAWPIQGLLTEKSEIVGVPVLYYRDGKGLHSFEATRGALTRPLSYDGPNPLVLLCMEPDTEDAADPQRPGLVPYARVHLLAHAPSQIVLLFPERKGPGGTQNIVLDFSPDQAPAGKATIVNGSRTEVAFSVNGSAHLLKPGERALLDRHTLEEKTTQGYATFRMRVAGRDSKGRWRPFYNNQHYLSSDRPCIFLILEYGSHLQVRYIEGLPAPP